MANLTLHELRNYNNSKLLPHTFNLDEIVNREAWNDAMVLSDKFELVSVNRHIRGSYQA